MFFFFSFCDIKWWHRNLFAVFKSENVSGSCKLFKLFNASNAKYIEKLLIGNFQPLTILAKSLILYFTMFWLHLCNGQTHLQSQQWRYWNRLHGNIFLVNFEQIFVQLICWQINFLLNCDIFFTFSKKIGFVRRVTYPALSFFLRG